MLFSRCLTCAVLLTLVLPSAVSFADVKVEDGYVRELLPRQRVTAVFMRLVNSGEVDVVISGVASSVSERAEIHAHRHRNGMMGMERVESVVVPAKGEFVFKPGAHHLMLVNVLKALSGGAMIDIELVTAKGVTISVDVPVRSVQHEKF